MTNNNETTASEPKVELKSKDFKARVSRLSEQELINFIHKQVIEIQIDRIHDTHADLFEQKQTKPVIEFFFTKVYSSNLSNKRFRDETLLRIFSSLPKYLSENGVERLRGLIELNDLTDKIDILITRKIIELFNPNLSFQLTREKYEYALSEIDLNKSRVKQVHYIIDTMEFFYNLSRRPFLNFFFGAARMVAKMMDAEILIQILEDGYNASRSLKSFEEFGNIIRHREINYLKYIYHNRKERSNELNPYKRLAEQSDQ